MAIYIVFRLNFCILLMCAVITRGKLLINFPTTSCDATKNEQCIQIRKCPYFDDLLNRSAIPRPRNVIKVIRERQCGFHGNNPYVCCKKPTPPPSTRPPPEVTRDAPHMPSPMELLEKINRLATHPNYHLLPNDLCGPLSTNSRITSGAKTTVNEFPWMALIAYYTDGTVDFRCAGTVINEWYVLTAAHCILNSSIIGVRLGEHNLDTDKDCDMDRDYCAPPTQDFYIGKIYVHPEYNSQTFKNDIALIRLATPANFSYENVQPICLPLDDTELTGKFAVISGWGVTETGFNSPVLLKGSLPVLPISQCQLIYKRFSTITSSQICAGGYKGIDSCSGDSGGPLNYVGLVEGTPRYIQYGIVSYGPRHCGTEGKPGIYTSVSKYMTWILDNLETEVNTK